jgi:hypothetical protein
VADPEEDFERSERDRVLADDLRLAPLDRPPDTEDRLEPVEGVPAALALGRVRAPADLAATRAGTGAALVDAAALAGAGAGSAPLVEAGAVALAGVGAAPLVAAGAAPLVAAGAAVSVRAGSVPFDRTAADSVTSVPGSGVPVELSIAPIVSVGSVKGKRTPVT